MTDWNRITETRRHVDQSDIIAGVDVAFKHDYFTISIVERREHKIYLRHLEAYQKHRWLVIKPKLLQMSQYYTIGRFIVDSTNNETVVDEMQALGMVAEGVKFTEKSKSDMINTFVKRTIYDQFVCPDLSHPDTMKSPPEQIELLREFLLQCEEQEYNHETVNPRLEHPEGRHDDLLWSTVLAVWGATKVPNISASILKERY